MPQPERNGVVPRPVGQADDCSYGETGGKDRNQPRAAMDRRCDCKSGEKGGAVVAVGGQSVAVRPIRANQGGKRCPIRELDRPTDCRHTGTVGRAVNTHMHAYKLCCAHEFQVREMYLGRRTKNFMYVGCRQLSGGPSSSVHFRNEELNWRSGRAIVASADEQYKAGATLVVLEIGEARRSGVHCARIGSAGKRPELRHGMGEPKLECLHGRPDCVSLLP